MNYIILNGVNSNTITGLIIQELPPISKPLMRTQIDQIDGRDGDIVTKLGYSTVDKELSIGLHGSFDIDSVIEYFASEGTVIFSNEPDKYYRYQVLDQIDFERLVRFRTATVTMHCQPFKYEVNEDPIEEAGSTDTTGDIVTFEAQSADAVGVKVNVEPYQNLNGYDYPWVGGAGVNKYPNCAISGTNSGVTITHDSTNESYKISGTSTEYRGFVASETFTLKAGTYKLTRTASSSSVSENNLRMEIRSTDGLTTYGNSSGNGGVFTLASDTEVKARIIVGQGNVDFGTGITYRFQIEVGTTATAWTPYENICPIYPANGKNLLPKGESRTTSAGLTITVNDDGTVLIKGTTPTTDFWGVQFTIPAGTYTYNGCPAGGSGSSYFMDIRNAVGGSGISGTGSDTGNGYTFTITSELTAYLNIRTASGYSYPTDGLLFKPMLRPAKITDSTYVPYNAIGITRTGKNLLNVNNSDRAFSGGTMVFEGSTLKLSGTATSTNAQAWPVDGFLLRAGTYTFSHDYRGTAVLVIGNWANSYTVATGTTKTFTLSKDTSVTWGVTVTSGTTYNDLVHAQIEIGSSATQYEPYTAERYYSQGTQYLPLNPNDWSQSTVNTTGYVTSGTRFAPTKWTVPFKNGHTYRVDLEGSYGSVVFQGGINQFDSSGNRTSDSGWKALPYTFTVSDTTVVLRPVFRATDDSLTADYIQAIGTSLMPKMTEVDALPEPVPFGMGVYKGTLDVTTGVLTVTKGSTEFNGDEAITVVNTYNGSSAQHMAFGMPMNGTGMLVTNASYTADLMCNWAKAENRSDATVWEYFTFRRRNNLNQMLVFTPTSWGVFTLDQFKAMLQTTSIRFVYELATPQTYQLTPVQVKTLLGYNNIWTDSGTVTVSVPNMISVVNEGNTTAKPTMTIYGSGNVGVWLNGMQVFQIALGDTGNITIDAEQMEAYQGGILRNRLVTGDYSNFVLQKGENTISVTGNVTNVEITNYSRWL